MRRAGGLLLSCLCIGSVASAAQPPLLVSGQYRVGELGVLNLAVSTGPRVTVKGLYVSGTRCAFTDTDQLLEGELEGTSLVGKLTTCMEGPGCQSPGVIPFVGVINEGVVTAYLSLPTGCTAPGLDVRLLRISPTIETLKGAAAAAYERKDWPSVQLYFRRATETPEGRDDPRLLELLGSAYNGGKQYAEGRQVLQRALSLAPGRLSNEDKATLLYNLACSEANLGGRDAAAPGRAIELLRQALQTGKRGQFSNELAADPDLDPLRELPEFQRVTGLKKANR